MKTPKTSVSNYSNPIPIRMLHLRVDCTRALGRLSLAGLFLISTFSYAGTIPKANNIDDLDLGTSWVGGVVPGVGDTALFDSTLTGPVTVTSLGANLSWTGIQVANPSGTVTIQDVNYDILTLAAGGIDMSSATADLSLQLNGGITLGAGQSWNVAGGRTLDASQITLQPYTILSNPGGALSYGAVDFSTTGTINIGNPLVNGIVGPWATYGGDDWAAGANGGAVSVFSGYVNTFNAGDNTLVSAAPANGTYSIGTLKQTGSWMWTNDPSDMLTLGGILSATGSSITYDSSVGGGGGFLLEADNSGELVFQGGGTLEITPNCDIVDNGSSDTGNTGISKSGSGTLMLDGDHDFTGYVTLNSGKLVVGSVNSLGNGSGYLNSYGAGLVVNGGTFDAYETYNPILYVNIDYLVLDGDFTYLGGSGVVSTLVGLSSGMFVNQNVRFTVVTNTYEGPEDIYDPNGYSITKAGGGTWDMTRAFDWESPTGEVVHVVDGTLQLDNTTGEGSHSLMQECLASAILSMDGGSVAFNDTATNHLVLGLTGTGNLNLVDVSNNPVIFVVLNEDWNGGIAIANSTFYGSLTGSGVLEKAMNNTFTLAGTNTYTGDTLITMQDYIAQFGWEVPSTNDVLALTGNGSIADSPHIDLQGSGTYFDVSQVTGGAYTLAAGQTIEGSGTVNGTLVVGAGATVAPSEASDVLSTLSFSKGPILAGTAAMNINGSSLTSDQLAVTNGGGALQYGGTLTVTTSGNALVAGDQFTLFTADSYAGWFSGMNLPALPSNLQWDASQLAVSGVIKVENYTTPSQPEFAATTHLSAGNVVLSGTGGSPGRLYSVVTSTNVALPLADWTPVLTNSFAADGSFSETIPVGGSDAQRFYSILVP